MKLKWLKSVQGSVSFLLHKLWQRSCHVPCAQHCGECAQTRATVSFLVRVWVNSCVHVIWQQNKQRIRQKLNIWSDGCWVAGASFALLSRHQHIISGNIELRQRSAEAAEIAAAKSILFYFIFFHLNMCIVFKSNCIFFFLRFVQ